MAAIPLLTAILVGLLYPLFFLTHKKDVIDEGFYRFNLGLAAVPAGVASVILGNGDAGLRVILASWIAVLLIVIAICWKKTSPGWVLLPAPAGILALVSVLKHYGHADARSVLPAILGGLVLCSVIYSTVLGHWYLNVQKLSIRPLLNSSRILIALLSLRLLWDIALIATMPVLADGDMISLYSFMQSYEGFFLGVALFFGTLFPLVLSFFILSTVKIESTQSATGLLYVGLISIFMGDIAYKYYLLKFALPL